MSHKDEKKAHAKKKPRLEFNKTLLDIATRSVYQLTRLPDEFITTYVPFLLGNDDPLKNDDIRKHQIAENFVFVGTALFRSIDIACALAKSEDVFPKVIIIDNSMNTRVAWHMLRNYFAALPEDSDWDTFFDNFDELIDDLFKAVRFDGQPPAPNFFKEFSKLYSFPFVRKVVLGVTTLIQDWGNEFVFQTIKRIYASRSIVAYPSNIIDFVDSTAQLNILKCIDCLKPELLLCTNFHQKERKPTRGYIFSNPTSLKISYSLNVSSDVVDQLIEWNKAQEAMEDDQDKPHTPS